jgi:hypothetical protein
MIECSHVRLKTYNIDHNADPSSKHVPHLELELCHFLFLNANMPLALKDDNAMDYLVRTWCIPNAIFKLGFFHILKSASDGDPLNYSFTLLKI